MPESFLTYWIKRGMQTEKEREEFHRERLAKCIKGADTVRKGWEQPLLGPGYWNLPKHTEQTKARRAEAAASPLSAYQSALDDVAAGRQASDASK